MSHHGKNPNGSIPAGNQPNAHEVANPAESSDLTGRNAQVEAQANRPVDAGPGHRGDRRDTHPSYSTGKGGRGSTAGKAPNGGRDGPLGASTRKSGPKSG